MGVLARENWSITLHLRRAAQGGWGASFVEGEWGNRVCAYYLGWYPDRIVGKQVRRGVCVFYSPDIRWSERMDTLYSIPVVFLCTNKASPHARIDFFHGYQGLLLI